MSERVVRSQFNRLGFGIVVIRSGLGQVAEYDVYTATRSRAGDIEWDDYLGGGTKRQATEIYNREAKVYA